MPGPVLAFSLDSLCHPGCSLSALVLCRKKEKPVRKTMYSSVAQLPTPPLVPDLDLLYTTTLDQVRPLLAALVPARCACLSYCSRAIAPCSLHDERQL